jgi:phosphatidylserine/phosphatidylglycerophosphate/cardiolipin synthase-like enzyme
VVTRPIEEFRGKDVTSLQEALALLEQAGLTVRFRPNIHQKFAVMDQRIVWYGSINLLSFGSAEESVMRLESPNIACELMDNLVLKP